MTDTVVPIHQRRGMLAVLSYDGEYSIIELLGDEVEEVEEGNELRWIGDYPLGGETIHNLTQNTTIEVYFQNHGVPEHQSKQQLLYE